jgi:Tfp pilus assembly protein PilX
VLKPRGPGGGLRRSSSVCTAYVRYLYALVGSFPHAEHGSALITALIMLTVMGFFLIGFQEINKSELGFAGYSRDSTVAFNVAEAGMQEAIKRLNMFGATPGTTCFVNSMTSGARCAASTSTPNTNTVVYQAPLGANSTVFPILSTASFIDPRARSGCSSGCSTSRGSATSSTAAR